MGYSCWKCFRNSILSSNFRQKYIFLFSPQGVVSIFRQSHVFLLSPQGVVCIFKDSHVFLFSPEGVVWEDLADCLRRKCEWQRSLLWRVPNVRGIEPHLNAFTERLLAAGSWLRNPSKCISHILADLEVCTLILLFFCFSSSYILLYWYSSLILRVLFGLKFCRISEEIDCIK